MASRSALPPLPIADEATRDALRRACAELDAAEQAPRPQPMCRALTELARCYARLGAVASAEACYQQALAWGRTAGAADLVVELLCEQAEASARAANGEDAEQAGRGHALRERARDQAFEAGTLAATLADASCEAMWLLRVSDVLLLCGDRDDALLVQARALDRMAECQPLDVSRLPAAGRLMDH